MPFDGQLINPTKWGSPRVSQRAIEEFGLIAVVPCNEMTGGIVRELLTGAALVGTGPTGWNAVADTAGATTNGAGSGTSLCYSAALPSSLRRTGALSIFWRGNILNTGTAGSYRQIAGMNYGPNISPYDCCTLGISNGNFYYGSTNTGGLYTELTSATTGTTGQQSLAYTRMDGAQRLYLNAAQIASASTAMSGPAYGASSQLTLGLPDDAVFSGRSIGWLHDIVLLGAQTWTPDQVASLHTDPYQVFEDPLVRAYFDMYPAAAGGGTTYNVSMSNGMVLGSTPANTAGLLGAANAGILLAQTANKTLTIDTVTAQGLILDAVNAGVLTFNAISQQGIISSDAVSGGFNIDGSVGFTLDISSTAGLDFLINTSVAAGINLTQTYSNIAEIVAAIGEGTLIGLSSSAQHLLDIAITYGLVGQFVTAGVIPRALLGPVSLTLTAKSLTDIALSATYVTTVDLTVQPKDS